MFVINANVNTSMKYLTTQHISLKAFHFRMMISMGITRDSFTVDRDNLFTRPLPVRSSPQWHTSTSTTWIPSRKNLRNEKNLLLCFLNFLICNRVNELAPKHWLPRWKFPAVGSMRIRRLGQFMKNLSRKPHHCRAFKLAAFSPWYVLAVVSHSLGRSQKKRGTERCFVNL